MMGERITEKANELMDGLDLHGPIGVARLLRQTDEQLFCGWREYPCIYDSEILSRVEALSKIVEMKLLNAIVKGEQNVFVFSGCGTSGRIAWLCARTYARIMEKHHPEVARVFRYAISGGDQSLVISNELPEDDPMQGAADLMTVSEDSTTAMLFGITCGLSAPYVAGQVKHAMEQENMTSVLIGFNPVALARDAPVEGWDRTCKDVFLQLEERAQPPEDKHHWVLNPIVGPEPLTGSSRMKGGSMTKILLDAIFLPAFQQILPALRTFPIEHNISSPADCVTLLERTARQAHLSTNAIAAVTAMAGDVLSTGTARLCYVGLSSSGLIGLIDASEMVDTYGCREDEVRAFVSGGWANCNNNEGCLASLGTPFHISAKNFKEDVLPLLSEGDGVIFLSIEEDADASSDEDAFIIDEVIPAVLASNARLAAVHVGKPPSYFDRLHKTRAILCPLRCDTLSFESEPVFAHFSLKLALNVITTGANVSRGAVYKNKMINITVSNNKLFHRASEIIADFAGCSCDVGKECMLRVVYGVDDLTDAIRAKPLSAHLEVAAHVRMVVPQAILLATTCQQKGGTSSVVNEKMWTVESARRAIQGEEDEQQEKRKTLRELVEEAISPSVPK